MTTTKTFAVVIEDSNKGAFTFHEDCIKRVPYHTEILHPLADREGTCDLPNCKH